MSLGPGERERYSRQLALPGWGDDVQERLRDASALVVGLGALGSVVAQYLVAAGVGTVGVADFDDVELSNLARQPLHYTPDVGEPKSASAAAKLRFLNPEVIVDEYPVRLDAENAQALVVGQSVVVDCSDSWATRYAVTDACCAERIDLVEGSVLRASGLVLATRPGESACWRCAFPHPPEPGSEPSCQEAGVLGPVAGVVGSLMALEAVKLLSGYGWPLLDRFLEVDGARARVTEVRTARRAGCRSCGALPPG